MSRYIGVIAPGGLGTGLECARQSVVDKAVEERPACGSAEREAVSIEHGAREQGFIEVVPGRQPASRITEQQLLRGGWCLDLVGRPADDQFDLGGRRQAHVLGRRGGLFVVDDDDTRHERLFGDAAGDEREVHGLLHAGCEQHEAPGIGAQVDGVMPTAGRGAVRGAAARRGVQYERCVFACSGQQQVLRGGEVGSRQERRCASACQRETRCRCDDAARPLGDVGELCLHRAFAERDRAVAVHDRVETLVANVASGRRAEGLAIPLDGNIAQRHCVFSTASWSWNCSPSSHTMELVGQRNTAFGSAGPPAA